MSNLNLNKVILAGRLTNSPELKATQSGVPVAQFSLAVNRKFSKDGQQETDFINCTAWRGVAEFITKYFRKGSSLCIVGSIQTRSWTGQNGQKKFATDIVVDEAMFVDGKNDAQQTEAVRPTNYMPDAYKSSPAPNFEGANADDLPF